MNDDAFAALADERRRTLLLALLDEDPRTVEVHASNGEVGVFGSDSELRTELYHNHLPKLEDYGFVRWDESTCECFRGPRFEEVRPLLEFLRDSAATTRNE